MTEPRACVRHWTGSSYVVGTSLLQPQAPQHLSTGRKTVTQPGHEFLLSRSYMESESLCLTIEERSYEPLNEMLHHHMVYGGMSTNQNCRTPRNHAPSTRGGKHWLPAKAISLGQGSLPPGLPRLGLIFIQANLRDAKGGEHKALQKAAALLCLFWPSVLFL